MKINYNVTGDSRKALVRVIADTMETKAKYMGMPSCRYEVGPFTVSKDGVLTDSEAADSETTTKVLEAITAAGFTGETTEETATEALTEAGETENEELQAPGERNGSEGDTEPTGLEISLPLDKVDTEKLTKILESKGKLIRKALGTETTDFTVEDDKVTFPWFQDLPDTETADAATKLIAAIGKFSKNSKRITMTEQEVESERYAFRGFLIRLGFSGPEYKAIRRRLLQSLSGASAFRTAFVSCAMM